MDAAAAVIKSGGRVHVCDTGRWGRLRERKSWGTLKWLLFFLLTQTPLAWKVFALKVSDIRAGWPGLLATRPGEKASWGSRGLGQACFLPSEGPLLWLTGTEGPFGTPSFSRVPSSGGRLEQFQGWCSLSGQVHSHFEARREDLWWELFMRH